MRRQQERHIVDPKDPTLPQRRGRLPQERANWPTRTKPIDPILRGRHKCRVEYHLAPSQQGAMGFGHPALTKQIQGNLRACPQEGHRNQGHQSVDCHLIGRVSYVIQ
jgi:hypothetical protein